MTTTADRRTVIPEVTIGRDDDGRGLSARDVEAFVAAWELGGRQVPLERFLGVDVEQPWRD